MTGGRTSALNKKQQITIVGLIEEYIDLAIAAAGRLSGSDRLQSQLREAQELTDAWRTEHEDEDDGRS